MISKYLKFVKENYNIEYDDERIIISIPQGSIILTETIPVYEFSDEISKEKMDELGLNEYDVIYKIEHLEIKNIYKNQGYAKKLINFALDKLKNQNVNFIYLNASPMGFDGLNLENLTNLYKKFGFQELKNQKNNILMYKKI